MSIKDLTVGIPLWGLPAGTAGTAARTHTSVGRGATSASRLHNVGLTSTQRRPHVYTASASRLHRVSLTSTSEDQSWCVF